MKDTVGLSYVHAYIDRNNLILGSDITCIIVAGMIWF